MLLEEEEGLVWAAAGSSARQKMLKARIERIEVTCFRSIKAFDVPLQG